MLHRLFIFFLCFPVLAIDWPVEFSSEGHVITIYQPQIESFEATKLKTLAAVSIKLKNKAEPVFGAVWIEGRVETDRDTRMVSFANVKVPVVKFPNATEAQIKKFSELLVATISNWDVQITMDQLVTAAEAVKAKSNEEALKHDPPEIIYQASPAVLVYVDGDPKLISIEGTDVMRVVNTPFFIVLNPSNSNHYLKGGAFWYESKNVEGPWKPTQSVPDKVVALSKTGEAKKEEAPKGDPPLILVRTKPAELLQTDGKATYSPIDQTGLLVVTNSDQDIFMEISSQRVFILLSGRWYVSKSLENGPWQHLPPQDLPVSFSKLSESGEKSHVLASVPGTQAALEAVVDTQVPQTATVKRSDISLKVAYDGEPKFKAIKGTIMSYAVNTDKSVLLINNQYYCCDNAVWYESVSPKGPWKVSVKVPKEVQTIPASEPIHKVKYVQIYDYTPDVVYVGYLPGYMGCYPYGGTVVYGTGYLYSPWYGSHYYPRPSTWGFAVRYNPYNGWSFGIGYRGPYGSIAIGGGGGWFIGGGVGYPGWYRPPVYGGWFGSGGYHHHHHGNININRNINIGQVNINRNNLYNKNVNRNRVSSTRVNSNRVQSGRLNSNRPKTSIPKTNRNNVFADKSGNVYRKNGSDWQKRSGSSWKNSSSSSKNRNLNRDYSSRTRSTSRSSQFKRSSGSRSGGGVRRR